MDMAPTNDRSAGDRVRIAVYGVGGVGGYFGARLIRGGQQVAFVARGEHLAVIRERGLCVTTPSGETLVQPSIATADPAVVGPADVVILGVKADQVSEAAEAMGPMLGEDSFVLPLQNGIEAEDRLSAVIGRDRVIAGLCGIMSWVTGPGYVRTLGDTHFIRFGELDNRPSDRTRALLQLFEAAGLTAEIPGDIHKAKWEKFLFVSTLGGLGAALGKPFGGLRDDEEARRMLELGMQEVFALGRSRGVALEDDVVERTMGFVEKLPAEGTASLQRDIADGRPSELEAWSGAIVRLARETGVAVPVHSFIYETLLPAEQSARAPQ
jgi:2-dehydropantoate 2-reductase